MANEPKGKSGGDQSSVNVTAAAAEAAASTDDAQRSATANGKAFKEQWDYLRENGRLPAGYGRDGAFIFKVKG